MNIAMLLLGALISSVAPLLMKPLSGELSPLSIALGRAIATIPLLLVLLKMEARIAGKAFRPLPIAAATWQIVGALLFAANGMVFAAALIFTPTATAYVIAASTPVYMLGYQLVWGEKRPSAAEYLIATVIFAGLLMFFLRGLQGGAAFGVGCAVAAGITFAGYFFAQGRLGNTVSSTGVPLAQGTVLLGMILTIPMSGLFLCVAAPGELLTRLWMPLSFAAKPEQLALLGLLALQVGLPTWLWAKSIPKVPPFLAGAAPTLIAVWGPLWTGLVYNEPFGGVEEIVGLVLVHGGVLAAVSLKTRRRRIPTS